MKKNIKRIIASVVACSSLSASLVSAKYAPSDVTYPWMDDVYRLDIPTMYGNDVSDTSDDANDTERTLIMMGIMKRNELGKFSPDTKLTKADYEAAIRAVYSGEAVDFDYYKSVYQDQKVYQKEIVTKLLSFVESTEIDAETTDVEKYAISAGILNGVVYLPSKEFTRREFATVLWNTLNCGYVEYEMADGGFNISVDDDKTILKDKLGVYKVKGTVNAIFGLNIYSTATPDAGYIEIDRVKYNAYGIDGVESLLGYNVEGYAKYDKDTEEYKLMSLTVSKKDETIYMNMEDYDRMDGINFYYLNEDGKEKYVKLDSLKHIMYNGDFVPEITEEMIDGNGSILFAKSTGSEKYDIAFIKEYQNFYTKRYLAEDMRLFFANDAKFKNEYYLDLDIEDGNVIYTQDGALKDISTLTQNLCVSIIQNNAKTYTEIVSTKNKKSGSVTSVYEDEVVIDGETFRVDPYYTEASKKTSSGVAKISWGSTGTFYYTADNMIVYFEPEGTANFALLRKAWFEEADDKVFVKVYTHTGEWITYETVEKPEIDGVKVSGEDVVKRLKKTLGDNNENSPTPIRVILKGDKIKFIDTLYDDAAEADDTERMKECGTFSGRTSWVKGWDMGAKNDAHIGDATPMFIVPTKAEQEDKYGISSGTSIPADTDGITYTAYNPDKFLCAKLAVMHGGAGAADTTDGWNFIYIRRLEERYDEEEDEVVLGVNCYFLTRGKEEVDERFFRISEDWKEKFKINNLEGSFVGIKFSGDEIVNMSTLEGSPYVENNKIAGTYGENFFYRMSGKNTDWVAGTVVDIDVSRNYMLVDTGDDGVKSVVFAVYVIAKTDAKDPKHEAEGIKPSEINPGDKIFYWGSLRRAYCCLVIENYQGN